MHLKSEVNTDGDSGGDREREKESVFERVRYTGRHGELGETLRGTKSKI